MTRIFTDGAEFGDMLFWDIVGGWTVSTTNPFTGNYSYFGNGNSICRKYITEINECYIRLREKVVTANNFLIPIFASDTTTLCYLGGNSLQNWCAYSSAGLLEKSQIVYNFGVWYLVEIYFKLDDAPNGRFVVKIDGIQVINFTGDTKPGAQTGFNNIAFDRGGQQHYVDDIAMNDTNGDIDNSWCEDGRVILLTPSGSGTTNSWANSGGVSASANYLYVDDIPSDSDTTYTYASASSTGAQDQYGLSNFTGGSLVNILRIFPETRIKMATTGSDVVKLGYLPSGGTDQLSGSIALTTSYTRITGTSASANPVTGLPWTVDDINGLEYVIEVG